ncbi:5-oxoprolinase [Colletotrichum plurivorum]|uniref:5-oxoprolinase n=1 Tax=Colletotrichum plurivorum TaxID=2175906 RepID=A0A8H6KJD2_9PEZI|nr:5-oxoprolinase [Colletotrichum plurivorum]
MDSTPAAEVHPPGASPIVENGVASAETSKPAPPAIETTTTTEKVASGEKPDVSNGPAPAPEDAIAAAAAASQPPSKPEDEDDLVTKVLKFLSTATPETLGAIAVGLAASTYFILGKVGLVLIGAFGGVVTFITYEARHPEVSRAVRGEKGIDVLERLSITRIAEPPKDDDAEEDRLIHGFDDFQPETREALTGLVDAVVRDYVKWWYSPILPTDRSFPLSCRKLLNSFLLSVSNHLYRKRPADSFLDFMTNSSSMFIVFLSELSAAFTEQHNSPNETAPEIISKYLEENPNSNLANLLNHPQQAAKFRNVADDLLGYLDRSAYNCDPARVFLREILAGVILEMTLQSCSKPEWINGWIVYLLEAGEPDFSQAIDVGMQTGPEAAANNANTAAFADIDGNLGNIALTKGNRNSLDMEKARRKESSAHKKQLSKADEEMEEAMEEMKRMNAMIAEEEAKRKSRQSLVASTESIAEIPEGKIVSSPGEMSPKSRSSAEKVLNGSNGSIQGDSLHSPITPKSPTESTNKNPSPKHVANGSTSSQFTSFDQIVPPARDEPDSSDEAPRKPPLTLHNANIILHDDAPNDNNRIRSKPAWDYLVQIEPPSHHYSGWMIVRKYSDFETLHEILRRIATISGATAFTEQHAALPNWKNHTRSSLRGELERYVKDACWYQSLAESEGMKRFLEKDTGNGHSPAKSGLAWDTVSKNMLDVLTMGPKGAVEGGKAVFGGVTGVFSNIGLGARKNTASSLSEIQTQNNRWSIGTPPRMDSTTSLNAALTSPIGSGPKKPRDSLDSQRSSVISTQPGKVAPMERRPSFDPRADAEADNLKPRSDRWERNTPSATGSREHSRASSLAPLQSPPLRSPSATSLDIMHIQHLPPPPDEMPEDYESPTHGGDMQTQLNEAAGRRSSTGNASPSLPQASKKEAKPARQHSPLSEQETNVAVELVFAIINEMYTLSSAWNIRRTLLAAAKSFLLRPGNPSLISIQKMMQESVIEANTSDAGLGYHLRKLRENTMPTDGERAAWPAEMTDEEKEKLRVKARNLLIKRGVPAALTGVMGQAATTDALGRIFDSLQIEEVARGFMFGMMLQAVRVVTH